MQPVCRRRRLSGVNSIYSGFCSTDDVEKERKRPKQEHFIKNICFAFKMLYPVFLIVVFTFFSGVSPPCCFSFELSLLVCCCDLIVQVFRCVKISSSASERKVWHTSEYVVGKPLFGQLMLFAGCWRKLLFSRSPQQDISTLMPTKIKDSKIDHHLTRSQQQVAKESSRAQQFLACTFTWWLVVLLWVTRCISFVQKYLVSSCSSS